jgi:hypothetical protein
VKSAARLSARAPHSLLGPLVGQIHLTQSTAKPAIRGIARPVEKFFEIKIDHEAIAFGNVALCLAHRLMGGASRPEAVTVLGKRRVPG